VHRIFKSSSVGLHANDLTFRDHKSERQQLMRVYPEFNQSIKEARFRSLINSMRCTPQHSVAHALIRNEPVQPFAVSKCNSAHVGSVLRNFLLEQRLLTKGPPSIEMGKRSEGREKGCQNMRQFIENFEVNKFYYYYYRTYSFAAFLFLPYCHYCLYILSVLDKSNQIKSN